MRGQNSRNDWYYVHIFTNQHLNLVHNILHALCGDRKSLFFQWALMRHDVRIVGKDSVDLGGSSSFWVAFAATRGTP